MKNILLLPFFLILTVSLLGQNTTLLEKEQEIDLSTDLNSLLNAPTAAAGDLNSLIKYALKSFSIDHLKYRDKEEGPKLRISLSLHDILDWDYVHSLQKVFFKDPKQVKAIYTAVLPSLLTQFKKMSIPERETYLKLIEDGIDYTKTFSLIKERTALEEIDKGLKGFHNVRGDLNAFIYRRIANEEISQKDCLYWLKRLKKDLSKNLPKTTTALDKYYIVKALSDNYFEAWAFDENVTVILEKTVAGYKMVDIKNIEYLYFLYSNRVTFYHVPSGLFIFPKIKNENFHSYLLRPGKAPIDFGPTEDPSNLNLNKHIFEFEGKDAWRMHNSTVAALNSSGVLETNSFPKKGDKPYIFLFKFQSGDTKLLYPQNLTELDKIKDVKSFYKRYESKVWITTASNTLYLVHNQKNVFNIPFPKTIKNISYLRLDDILVEYEDGQSELIFLSRDNKKLIQLPADKAQSYTFIRSIGTSAAGQSIYLFGLDNNLKGVMNEQGKSVLKPIYKSLEVLEDNNHLLKSIHFRFGDVTTGLLGIIDQYGKIVLPPNYTKIDIQATENSKNNYFRLQTKDNKIGLANMDGKIILTPRYKSLIPLRTEMADNLYNVELKKAETYFLALPKNAAFLNLIEHNSFQRFIEKNNQATLLFFETYRQGESNVQFNEPLFFAPKSSYLKAFESEQKDNLEIFLYNDMVWNFQYPEVLNTKSASPFGIIDVNEKVLYKNIKELYIFDPNPTLGYYEDDEDLSYQEIPLYFIGRRNKDGIVKAALFSKAFESITDYIFDWTGTTERSYIFDFETFEEIDYEFNRPNLIRLNLQDKGWLILKQNNKECLYNYEGKMMVPPVWDSIIPMDLNYFLVRQDNSFGLIDSSNTILLEAQFENIYILQDIPLIFAGKTMPDKSVQYALHSLKGEALTETIFTVQKSIGIEFDPETYEELEVEIDLLPGKNADFDKKVMQLQIGDKKVLYNFEGKRLD